MSENQSNNTEQNPDTGTSTNAAANNNGIPSPAAASNVELETLKKEVETNRNHYLRSLADLDNLRKRHAREKDELRQYAASRVIEDMLPILDNLGFAQAAAQDPNATTKTLLDGINMIADQIKKTLAAHGLAEINPLGQPFDHNLHDAISHIPDPAIPADHVAAVTRIGYTLNNKLLRPAAVAVSSGPAQQQ